MLKTAAHFFLLLCFSICFKRKNIPHPLKEGKAYDKIQKHHLGGIQKKLFNLVLIMLVALSFVLILSQTALAESSDTLKAAYTHFIIGDLGFDE